MDVIPVLDIKGGVVVHARGGERARYAPIETPLARSSDPVAIAGGMLDLHRFRRLYIADLDGIEGRARNDAALERLARACPGVELWVDNGLGEETACRAWLARGLGRLVLGSECQRDAALPRRLGGILSLDFRGPAFLGPPRLMEDEGLWPPQVIAMTLSRVGAALGPDLAQVAALKKRSPRTAVFAAGGVRNAADLVALEEAGAAGALVASALHDGRITRSDLAAMAGEHHVGPRSSSQPRETP